MKIFGRNVGRHDAESRQVAALLLAVGGVCALPVVHDIAWLVWLLGATMVALGVRYVRLGLKGCGTSLFGTILAAFGVADVVLASSGEGIVACVVGVALALIGWGTAVAGRCPVNALLGLDTRDGAPAAPGVVRPHPAKP